MYNDNIIPNTYKNGHEFITFGNKEPFNFHLLSVEEQINTCYPLGFECGQLFIPYINKIGTVMLTGDLILNIYGSYKNVWFIGKEIAKLINYRQIREGTYDVNGMIKNLEPYMKLKFVCKDDVKYGHQNPLRLFINELGLYKIIFGSRKLESKDLMYSIYNSINRCKEELRSYTITNIINTIY